MGVNFAFQVSTRTPRISSQDRNNEWFVDFDAFGTKIKDDAGIDDDQPTTTRKRREGGLLSQLPCACFCRGPSA